MKTGSSFWSGLLLGSLIAGNLGYWWGIQSGAGVSVSASPRLHSAGEIRPSAAPKIHRGHSAEGNCAGDGLGVLRTQALLECLTWGPGSENLSGVTSVFQEYFSRVLSHRARLSDLVDALGENSTGAVEYLLNYIEVEIDREKIALASDAVKQLLALQQTQSGTGANAGGLIDFLNRLLWLTPDDVSVNLWLAKLFLQRGQIEEVRYHALVAAAVPAYAEAAADLLREIDVDSDDDGSIVVDLDVAGNQYFIAATINGNAARLLLDTGASISGVSSGFVGNHPEIVGDTQSIVLNTAGGLKTGRKFIAGELAFGELQFSDHAMVIFDGVSFKDFDGLLGVDVLRQGSFYIDRKASKLRIFLSGGELY